MAKKLSAIVFPAVVSVTPKRNCTDQTVDFYTVTPQLCYILYELQQLPLHFANVVAFYEIKES